MVFVGAYGTYGRLVGGLGLLALFLLPVEARGAGGGAPNDALTLQIRELVRRLDHRDPDERLKALSELRQMAAEARGRGIGRVPVEALPAVARRLDDSVPEVRGAALWTVSLFGEAGRPAIPRVMARLRDREWEVRGRAAECLGYASQWDPEIRGAVPALMAALRDVPAVRVDAIRALAQFHAHAKPAMPTLLRLAAHPEERTRSAAVRAISWIDPASPPSIRVFVRALNETKLASAALTGLRLAGDAARDAVPAVMAFLKRQTNPYPHILAEGMRVLGGAGRGHAEVVPFLQRYLSHPTEGVSKEAATALGRLGAAAREAIPALEALAKDSVAEIAAAALAAVASINKALEEADKGDETPHSEQETGSTTDREAED